MQAVFLDPIRFGYELQKPLHTTFGSTPKTAMDQEEPRSSSSESTETAALVWRGSSNKIPGLGLPQPQRNPPVHIGGSRPGKFPNKRKNFGMV